jgi:trehalose 6-phosphate phosphatase
MAGTPRTQAGRAGLAAVIADPRHALIGLDFDGTLAPIVDDPADARPGAHAAAALIELAGRVGTLAVITGRPAAEVVRLGDLDAIKGITVLGLYGSERWQDGELTTPAASPAITRARNELPALLTASGAAEGSWIEDKGHALAVHTRPAADPQAAIDKLREPLTELAARLGLAAEPGRFVLELRPPGVDKGAALTELVRETKARSAIYCGDDVADLSAFDAVSTLRGEGVPGCTVASANAEAPRVAAAADLVVDGPDGIAAFLAGLAALLS